MTKKKWLIPLAAILCIVVFAGYRVMDRMATDTKPPVIEIEEGELVVSALAEDSSLMEGVSAKDNRDGDVTASLVVESVSMIDSTSGTVNVIYAAFDKAGNVTKAERNVTFSDYESPRFDLKNALVYTENSGFDVLTAITAQDMIDGNISHWIRATNLDQTTIGMAGEHQIQFRVTNSLGDLTALTLPVEVCPAGAYQGRVQLQDYLVYIQVGELFDAKDYPVSFTLYGTEYSLEGRLGENITMEIINEVDNGVPGLYKVSYFVNLGEYTGYSKLFVIVEG